MASLPQKTIDLRHQSQVPAWIRARLEDLNERAHGLHERGVPRGTEEWDDLEERAHSLLSLAEPYLAREQVAALMSSSTLPDGIVLSDPQPYTPQDNDTPDTLQIAPYKPTQYEPPPDAASPTQTTPDRIDPVEQADALLAELDALTARDVEQTPASPSLQASYQRRASRIQSWVLGLAFVVAGFLLWRRLK